MILSSDVTDVGEGREGRDCFGGVAGSKFNARSSLSGVSGRSFCSRASGKEGGVGRASVGSAGGGPGKMGFPIDVGLSGRCFVWSDEGNAGDMGGDSGLLCELGGAGAIEEGRNGEGVAFVKFG